MKTSELTGAALDWAVNKCEGATETAPRKFYGWGGALFGYSTNWAQGGKIIEREGICLWSEGYDWEAKTQIGSGEWLTEWAETPLVAAMRCYVASKLGDNIEIPEELNQGESK